MRRIVLVGLVGLAALLAGCSPFPATPTAKLLIFPVITPTVAVASTATPLLVTPTPTIPASSTSAPTPTATAIPPTATPPPPIATPTQVPTPTRGPSSVFAPEPTAPIPPTAAPPHIAVTPANTPVPFARFTAADVVTAFRNAGLYTVDPHPLPANFYRTFFADVPVGSGQVVSFVDEQEWQGDLLVFTTQADMEAAWGYLLAHPVTGPSYQWSQYRNANVILAFFVPRTNPPALAPYQAVFLGMR